jgi:hypothetical protein
MKLRVFLAGMGFALLIVMTATHTKSNRSDFSETISLISVVHSAKLAKLDFWGPVALVCVIGTGAHLLHAVVVTLFY